MSNDFDWLDDSGVVIHEVPAIAVHRNSRGQLVIRQRDIYDDGESSSSTPRARRSWPRPSSRRHHHQQRSSHGRRNHQITVVTLTDTGAGRRVNQSPIGGHKHPVIER